MNQNDAITAAQTLTTEAERLRTDAAAARGEAEALQAALQTPSEVVQQVITRLAADAEALDERSAALARVAAQLLSSGAPQAAGVPEGLAALDALARIGIPSLLSKLAQGTRGHAPAADRTNAAAPPVDLEAVGKMVEGALGWISKGATRGPDGR